MQYIWLIIFRKFYWIITCMATVKYGIKRIDINVAFIIIPDLHRERHHEMIAGRLSICLCVACLDIT